MKTYLLLWSWWNMIENYCSKPVDFSSEKWAIFISTQYSRSWFHNSKHLEISKARNNHWVQIRRLRQRFIGNLNKCLREAEKQEKKLTSWAAPVPHWRGHRWPYESAFPWNRDPDRHCWHAHPWRCWGTRQRGLRCKGPKAPSASGKLYRRVRCSSEPPGERCCLGTGRHLRKPKHSEDVKLKVWENKTSLSSMGGLQA